jgi:predicted porin
VKKRYTIILSLCAFTCLEVTANANEEINRERQHSVKQLIGEVAKRDTKEMGVVDELRHMFTDGKVTGQIRSMYMQYNEKNSKDTYATALGGTLKYELAEFKGLSGSVAFITSNDINYLSGDGEKRNSELSGTDKSYTQVEEAYITYRYEDLLFKAGRQIFDTPLADSDDIRMIPNSFEAYTALYEAKHFNVMLGHIERWQGSDAGLENKWVKTGKDGASFAGLTYDGKILEGSLWAYNFSNASETDIANGADANGNNSYYVDFGGHYHLNKDMFVHGVVQYLKQEELSRSGVAAEIYGATAEFVVDGLGLNVGYNESKRKAGKHSFSGYGGGTLFTSMDAMILDEITEDRSAHAWVAGVSYEIGEMNFLYAYGDFKGDADSAGVKAHIVEQNIGFEYTHNEELTIGALYVIDRNKEDSLSPDFNNDNFRVLVAYNF